MEYETRSRDLQWMNWVGGLALGALAMYIADPSQGRRRRALLQDKVTSVSNRTSKTVSHTLNDARNRLTGLQAEASRLLSSRRAKPLDDHVLEARVRSRLGRSMSHLHDVQVKANHGTVTLSGNIDADEEERLLSLVEAIPGVEKVQHHLQQQPVSAAYFFKSRSSLWMAGAVGAGALAWYGFGRRMPMGLIAATGLGLLARRAMRTSALDPVASIEQALHQAFEAEKSIMIKAAPETVFDVWSRYENFPHFMSHVVEVRDLGQNRSHWVVQGPAGVDVEWDAVLTAVERPHRLAWQSESGSTVDHQGSVRLEAVDGGHTRATVRLMWKPPAGAIGEGIAVLLGADPEIALEEDLQRMKQFIESGLPARAVAEAQVAGGPILH